MRPHCVQVSTLQRGSGEGAAGNPVGECRVSAGGWAGQQGEPGGRARPPAAPLHMPGQHQWMPHP